MANLLLHTLLTLLTFPTLLQHNSFWLCEDAAAFIKAHKENVVAIHCKVRNIGLPTIPWLCCSDSSTTARSHSIRMWLPPFTRLARAGRV